MPTYNGTSSDETITGSESADTIRGNGGNDTLNGLGGDDIFAYDPGNGFRAEMDGDGGDTIFGGLGNDLFHVTGGYLTAFWGRSTYIDPPSYSLGVVAGVATFTVSQISGYYGSTEPPALISSVQVTLREVEMIRFTFTDEAPPPLLSYGFFGYTYSTNDVVTIGNLDATPLIGLIEFDGGHGNDRLDARAVTNVVRAGGGTGSDILISGSGNDILRGGQGNDTLEGGAGSDLLEGGAGDDAYVRVGAEDVITELAGEGYDSVTTLLARYIAPANVERIVHVGTENFTGIGNAADNWIQGYTGNDYLIGFAGNDILYGSGGFANTLQGGIGDDVYLVENNNDTLVEFSGEGRDRVETTLRTYVLRDHFEDLYYQGSLSFTGTGNAANNLIRTGSGNDTLIGLGGDNTLNGGAGIDLIDYSRATTAVVVDLNEGLARANGFGGRDVTSNIENLTGGAFGDTLIGEAGSNVLRGGLGNDYLIGLGGDDTLHGGSDTANALQGGTGHDTYYMGHLSDTLIEFAGEGTDTVITALTRVTLAANLENLTFTGTEGFRGIGNSLDNVIRGGAGVDRLQGLGGNDTLIGGGSGDILEGGAGDDLYVFDASAVRVTEAAGAGTDTILTFLTRYTLDDNVENLTYGSIASEVAFTGLGNDLGNIIRAGAGRDRVDGNAGNDTLYGFDGNDIINGGAGDDRIYGGTNADEMNGGAGADRFIYQGGQETVLAGDLINDFNRAQGDKIDLAQLISAYMPSNRDAYLDGYISLEAYTFNGQAATRIFFDMDGSQGLHSGPIPFVIVVGDALTPGDIILS